MKRRDGQQGSIFWFEIPYRPDLEAEKNFLKSHSNDDDIELIEDTVVLSPKSSTRKTSISMASVTSTNISVKEGKLRILVADDTPSILKMSSKMLQKQGHTISTAEDGAQALEDLIEGKGSVYPFDVVLMDLQMPVMDGLESTARIRRFEEESRDSRKVVIIGVSANSDGETMNDAYKAGVDAFIPKPFNCQLFTEVYNGVMEKRKLASCEY